MPAHPLRLEVDRIRCDGYGMCAELLPELIELDDWGYPIIRPGLVPAELEGLARRVVAVCPVLALRLATAPRGARGALGEAGATPMALPALAGSSIPRG
jgi:ferredoxin